MRACWLRLRFHRWTGDDRERRCVACGKWQVRSEAMFDGDGVWIDA